jgi:RNA polymerase sigma factor FliA
MLDSTERDKLIRENLGYVRSLAAQIKRDLPPHLELDELVAYGSQGLVEAAKRFDPTKGAAFTTFAYYRIRGAIFDGLRRLGWLKRSTYHRFAAASDEVLGNLADRAPSPGPGSMSPKDAVADLGQALDNVATIFLVSLDSCGEPSASDDQQLEAIEQLAAQEDRAAIQRALARLPEKERRLIELHYYRGLNLQEAGQELGLSKSWASRLHARAIQLLSRELTRPPDEKDPEATSPKRPR